MSEPTLRELLEKIYAAAIKDPSYVNAIEIDQLARQALIQLDTIERELGKVVGELPDDMRLKVAVNLATKVYDSFPMNSTEAEKQIHDIARRYDFMPEQILAAIGRK